MTVVEGGWVELRGSAEIGIGLVGVEQPRRGLGEDIRLGEGIRLEGGSRLDCRMQGDRRILLVRREGGSLGTGAVAVVALRSPVPVPVLEGVGLRGLRRARLVEGGIRLGVVRRSRTLN